MQRSMTAVRTHRVREFYNRESSRATGRANEQGASAVTSIKGPELQGVRAGRVT